jgi:chromosome condensin MukBEF complex kleisin-like MukF subunit
VPTAKEVGSGFDSLIASAKTLKWVAVVLSFLVIGLVIAYAVRDETFDSVETEQRVIVTNQAEIKKNVAELKRVVDEVTAGRNQSNTSNPELQEVFRKINEIHQKCVVEDAC